MAYTHSGASVPVTQMISGKHDHQTIAHWLKEMDEQVEVPREVIIDESAALLLAVVIAFTQFENVFEYLNRCHSIIDGSTEELPKCYIRHDISHIVKNITKSKYFKTMTSRSKRFYLCCIGILFKLERFDEAKNVIKDMLTLILCEYESCITESAIIRLTILIGCHRVENMYDYKNDEDEEGEEESYVENLDEIRKKTENPIKIMNWYINLKLAVGNFKPKNVKSTKNEFYYPVFESFLQSLLYKMPTWSAIMRKSFNSPNINVSSSNCESEFKYIKRFLFKNVKHMRVDKFLFTHMNDIIGRMVLAIAYLNNYKKLNQTEALTDITTPKRSVKRKRRSLCYDNDDD